MSDETRNDDMEPWLDTDGTSYADEQDAPTTEEIVDRAVQNLADLPVPESTFSEDVPTDTHIDDAWDEMPWSATIDEEEPGEPFQPDTTLSEDAAQDDGGDEPFADYETDEDDDEEAGPNAFSRAGDAAREAHQSIKDGIAAFRSVREASQRHSSARDELRIIREQLDMHTEELRHRIDIEQRYPQIVSEQTAEIEEASSVLQESQERAASLDSERADLESQLAIMKDRHEDQLRPYRNVAESTKGRADDTARALADARRAVKSAENNQQEAVKRRDQRISAANRAKDSAADRLRKIEAELEATQRRESPDQAAIARLQNEHVSVKAHLDSATAEVPVITEEANQTVVAAQQRLFDQKQLLAQAEREAEAAKKEANERRAEYDELLKQAQEREKALADQIKVRVTASEAAQREAKDAQARIDLARELLDEAEEIHATPQDTIALRDLVSREQTDLDVQQDAVDELAANERELRKGTFKQRLLLVLGGVLLLAIIIAIVVAIVTSRKG